MDVASVSAHSVDVNGDKISKIKGRFINQHENVPCPDPGGSQGLKKREGILLTGTSSSWGGHDIGHLRSPHLGTLVPSVGIWHMPSFVAPRTVGVLIHPLGKVVRGQKAKAQAGSGDHPNTFPRKLY